MRLCAYQPDIAPNLGAMIRLSACFSTPLDIIEPCGFPLSIKSLRRAAMDYAHIADLTRHDSWEVFQTTRPKSRRVLLTTKGNTTLWDFRFRSDDILVMGRESAGVPDQVADECTEQIVLPMNPQTRSLNVSMCAGIALAEAIRQTR